MGWMAAIPIASAVLGGLGGKSKGKKQKTTETRNVLPPQQLGGWDRLRQIMDSLQTAPQYRPGANNPYLSGGMEHIFGRAGITPPAGGYGNPYLSPPQMAEAAPAPTPTPTPQPRPGMIAAKRKRDKLMEQIP